MASPVRQGVFICQGGSLQPDSLDLKKLRWTAEASTSGPVVEVTQACQTEGARRLAGLVKEAALDSFLLGACPLAGPAGALGHALAEEGLDPAMMSVLDVCRKPEGGLGPCLVDSGAQQSLCQALAADLGREPLENSRLAVSDRVLVKGEGLPALLMVQHLSQAGYPVLLLTPSKRLARPEHMLGPEAMQLARHLAETIAHDQHVQQALGASLLELTGTAGDFTVCYVDREGEVHYREVGAVVVSQGPPVKLNLQGLGIGRGLVWPLEKLLGLLDSPAHMADVLGSSQPPRVGLLVGMAHEADPMSLRAALAAGQRILDMGGQATLFTGNAKVAGDDLAELMYQARQAGMLQEKFTQPRLSVSHGQGVVTVTYFDEVLRRDLQQEFDLLAADQTPAPNGAYHALADVLGLGVGADGRLQPSRVAALPTSSIRGGVFVSGPARSAAEVAAWADEAAQVAWSIDRLLAHGQAEAPAGLIKIDRSRCALCLTCVRVCPHGAMQTQQRRPAANPLACTTCGTCAAECPMDAIQIVGQEDRRYEQQIKAALPADPQAGPSLTRELLVILCANSAGAALAAARLRGLGLPSGARLVQVPCAGKLDPAMVLDALARGFDAVAVVSCHRGACHSFEGEAWAELRIEHLRRLLAEIGYDPDRLITGRVQASQASRLADMINQAWETVQGLADNPLRAGAQVRSFLNRYTVQTDECYTLL